VSVLEAGDPLHCGAALDPVPGVGGLDAQTDHEVRLPCPGRAEQDVVARLVEEGAAGEVNELVPFQGGLVVKD
jgi:hypothetical protein